MTEPVIAKDFAHTAPLVESYVEDYRAGFNTRVIVRDGRLNEHAKLYDIAVRIERTGVERIAVDQPFPLHLTRHEARAVAAAITTYLEGVVVK